MSGPSAVVHHGDCIKVMRGMDADSVDAIVTDPPYGLEFMGKDWDHGIAGIPFWREALRVAKPGAHMLAFGGTRTYHRLMCAIEDAGWEIRDCIMWVYGQGFPKSLDVSKAIDKAAGAERDVVQQYTVGGTAAKGKHKGRVSAFSDDGSAAGCSKVLDITAPATPAAQQWHGWGTALKPAWEPIVIARKPLTGAVAANVLEHGTGGINIDGCRIPGVVQAAVGSVGFGSDRNDGYVLGTGRKVSNKGRWPANLIHDGSDDVVELFPSPHGAGFARPGDPSKYYAGRIFPFGGSGMRFGDSGSAARFFYCAKTNRKDRNAGCEGMQVGEPPGSGRSKPAPGRKSALGRPTENHHPTVKPTKLMRYLCRLVTPPDGLILDPFAGSGSTGKAAMLEGFRFVGIEKEQEYVDIARARIAAAGSGARTLST